MTEENKIKNEEFYFRGGEKFKILVDSVRKIWVEKYGFDISNINITNMIAEKINKVGGIRSV